MKNIMFLLFGFMVVSCSARDIRFSGSEEMKSDFWSSYQKVLDMTVVQKNFDGPQGEFFHTGVDYMKLRSSSVVKELMAKQIDLLARVKVPEKKYDRMAFLINVYNFLTLVDMKNHPDKTMIKIGWKNRHHKVAGVVISLDEIEHTLLRPMGDARIHFAINCASLSCPALKKDVYMPTNLEVELGMVTKNALKNPLNLRVEGRSIYGTQLFNWFADDFEKHSGSVDSFVRTYAPQGLKKGAVKTKIDYLWTKNAVKESFAHIQSLL